MKTKFIGRFCTVRPFDTEKAGASVATGFIVDKQKGLILTNRYLMKKIYFFFLIS